MEVVIYIVDPGFLCSLLNLYMHTSERDTYKPYSQSTLRCCFFFCLCAFFTTCGKNCGVKSRNEASMYEMRAKAIHFQRPTV